MLCGTYCEAVVLVYMLLEEQKSTPLIKTAERRDEVRRDGSPAGHSVSLVFWPRGWSSALPRHNAGRCLPLRVRLPLSETTAGCESQDITRGYNTPP